MQAELGAMAMATSAPSSAASPSLVFPAHTSFPPKLSSLALPSSSSPKSPLRAYHKRPPLSFLPPLALAAAQESSVLPPEASTAKTTKYYFLVANAKFMLDEEEHFQELMNERLRLFGERNREQDFWIVIEPKFLENFPDMTRRLNRPAVALVSTDYLWITFMKLRLDRVLRGEIEAETMEEALKSNPVPLHFEKPQKWTAPYSKYTGAWWTRFLPPQEQ